jgi:carbamoyltransferase
VDIIGLHNSIESGACLIRDGALLEAVSEERFTRIKNFKGAPAESLTYILNKYSIDPQKVERYVYCWYGGDFDRKRYTLKLVDRVLRAMELNPRSADIVRRRAETEFHDAALTDAFHAWLGDYVKDQDRVLLFDHHQAHAWSAFSCSPFSEAIVFTMDGRGHFKSGSVSVADCEQGVVEKEYLLTFDSLALLYGQITHFLGYQPHRHEGKVTGLAAFGNPEKTLPFFRKLVTWENDAIVTRLGPYVPFNSNFEDEFVAELSKYSREDIAAGVQAHVEDLVVRFVRHWLKRLDRPDVRNLCLAGGLFANVKINQRVAEIEGVDNVFVFPNMGDGGLTVGGACFVNFVLTGRAKVAMPTVYLGPDYSTAAIEVCLNQYAGRLAWARTERRVQCIVEDLVAARVVGLFAGRMEFGPRALGGRSILYHGRDATVNDWLNKRLRRTEFMPFAPVTPEEYAAGCYKGWQPDHVAAHFMTRTYDCTPEFTARHPAVVHIDGTARPQIVNSAMNGNYYEIARAYCERTGERALINTSFNMHEEPIICSPRDAVESLLQDTVDVLYLEDFRVTVASHESAN